MNALEAIGYMGMEDGRIVAVRNLTTDSSLRYSDLIDGDCGLNLEHGEVVSSEWELGWECKTCCGDGTVTVPCPRCGTGYTVEPCCGGFDDATCPDCTDGIKWESEY